MTDRSSASDLNVGSMRISESHSGQAVIDGPGDSVTLDTTYSAIDAYVEAHVRRLRLPGAALAIVEGDRIVHFRGFGRVGPGGEPPSSQTPFFIGSVTKSFTAMAVMQLVEAGKVELDAPVQQYVPWFRLADPEASRRMTVRHLLVQSSGLPTIRGWQFMTNFETRPDACERQIRQLASLTLSRPVGAAFEYSNLNYDLLGLVIESASGQTYADYIQQYVFDPLGMQRSYTSKLAARQNGLAVGHQSWFGFPIPVPDLPVPLGSLSSGQLISCADDMCRYLIAHLNGGRYGDSQVLSPEGVAELHRPAVEAIWLGLASGDYGMGWYVEDDPLKIVWHSGLVPDFYACVTLLPDQLKGMVLLTNVDHFMMQPIMAEVCMGATYLLGGLQPPPTRLGAIPWAVRGLLIIPVLQLVGVIATARLIRRWRTKPESIPDRRRLLRRHVMLPLVPNALLAAVPAFLQAKGLTGFLRLMFPELPYVAGLGGLFAGFWSIVRARWLLRFLRMKS